LFVLEYAFYLIDWTRADFATQIQINEKKSKTLSGLMNPTRIP